MSASGLVKCLVWDLDNTLWRGTLLEGDAVEVDDRVRHIVRELDSRGILQSIASRNHKEDAREALERTGLAEYFILPQVGWGPKSRAIRSIADILTFALATIAFVDDQPAERAEVAYHLPEVRCYDAADVLSLIDRPEFSPAHITEDAVHRRKTYQSGFRRERARAGHHGSEEDFLRSLAMVLSVRRAEEPDITRLEELTLRTSQMNATGVHYSDEALRTLRTDPEYEVLVVSLDDRFGTHGAVGVLILRYGPGVWHLKLLATSCRVVAFGVGSVLLRWLTDAAARAGVHLIADFRRTERNRMMEVAYRFARFEELDPMTCRRCGSSAVGGVPQLHLRPDRQDPSTTMRVDAVDLTAPRAR